MAGGIFDPEFDQLPMRIPIFPLPSCPFASGRAIAVEYF